MMISGGSGRCRWTCVGVLGWCLFTFSCSDTSAPITPNGTGASSSTGGGLEAGGTNGASSVTGGSLDASGSGGEGGSGSGSDGGSGVTGSGVTGSGASGSGASGGEAGAGNDGGSVADGAPSGDGATMFSGPCTPPNDMKAPLAKLSQTGCMDAKDPTKLAALVVPYEVNSPLWSDKADKTRGMVLPPGGKIHVKDCTARPQECPVGSADEGKWVFPIGTVMIKNFMFDAKLVETRLFVRHDADNWVGYSYQWDEAQTEATIVDDSGSQHRMFNTGTRMVDWSYPSRLDCVTCHTPTGGFTLGPETAQMNRTVGGANQIDGWTTKGLFDTTIAKPYKAALVTPYPGQLGNPPASATVEQKARSYLHANCAFCHRPDDYTYPNFDLRYDTPLADAKVCNATPGKGDVGVADALLITPGDPSKSIMVLRMNTLENMLRMPKIASYVVDQQAVDLISAWITSVAACP